MLTMLLMYIKAFAVGGLFCLIGEILILKTKLTPARILVCYITAGVILSAGGLTATAGGIAAAIFFGFLAALCFKPKPKT